MKLLRQDNSDLTTQRIAVVGTFDGVHCGHRFLFEQMMDEASNRCLEPTVITFAQHPLSVINPSAEPPQLSSVDERIATIGNCGVKCCILLDFNEELRQMSARQFLEMINRCYGIKCLVVGFNTRFGRNCSDGVDEYRNLGKEVGVDVIEAPEYGKEISSSSIRNLISNKKIAEANKALGYNYNIIGKVVKGKQLGRTIGFPTANVDVENKKKLIPAPGVYAVDATIPKLHSKKFRAMLNIGSRPTVDGANAPISIEAHILNFNEDIYGMEIEVEFLKYIREERAFASLDELSAQLNLDKIQALSV